MRESEYERVAELIEVNNSIVEFAPVGNGVSQEWIEKAEIAIGVPLPTSYKWWLASYGGGEIGGEEIFSVYGEDFDKVVGGDIVYMYRLDLAENQSAKLVPLCQSDIDGRFSFDTKNSHENEYPVHSHVTGQRYAENFFDFLEKRIAAFS